MKEKVIYFEKIEAYLEGQLSDSAKGQFETELTKNAVLKKEYDAYLATKKLFPSLEFDALKAHPSTSEKRVHKKRQFLRLPYLVAASVLLLFGLFGYSQVKYSDIALTQQAYQPMKSETIRGAETTDATDFEQLSSAYLKGDYTFVIQTLETQSQNNGLSVEAAFLLGHSCFLSEQYEKSANAFRLVEELKDVRYFENASWNHSIALLKAGDLTATKKALQAIAQQDNHSYQTKAISLLHQLDSKWRFFLFL